MENQNVYLKPVTLKNILKFAVPTIAMTVFMSFYTMVDGLFVSNLIGTSALSAINLTAPVIQLVTAVSTMLATGGSAVIMKKMGEHKTEEAKEDFTFLILVNVVVGFLMCGLGYLMMDRIFAGMNLSADVEGYCVEYLSRYLLFTVPILLMNNFTLYMIASEKAALSLVCSVTGGVLNMVLDFVFIAVFHWGIAGAAAATAASQLIGGLIPLVYFIRPSTSRLQLVKTSLSARILGKTCINGSSELMTNISMSLVNILYNFQLMRYIGEDGVAAYGIIMYVSFIFAAIFIGYSIGSAPVIGYHYGAGNYTELKGLFRKSLCLITLWNIVLTILAVLTAQPLAQIFVGYDASLTALTRRALTLYSLSFLCMGLNIFGSAFFTALGNGVVSAAISFLRTLLFQVAAVLLLPLLLGLDGIWLAIVAAEVLALVVTVFFLIKKGKYYHYV